MLTDRQQELIDLELARAHRNAHELQTRYESGDEETVSVGAILYHRGYARGIALVKELLRKFD